MSIPADQIFPLAFLVFIVAALYSSVGHGGASGYLAAMTLFAVPAAVMSTSALMLNVIVSSLAAVSYIAARHFLPRLTWPFLAGSIPAAFVGGMFFVFDKAYFALLAVVLVYAAVRLAFYSTGNTAPSHTAEANHSLPHASDRESLTDCDTEHPNDNESELSSIARRTAGDERTADRITTQITGHERAGDYASAQLDSPGSQVVSSTRAQHLAVRTEPMAVGSEVGSPVLLTNQGTSTGSAEAQRQRPQAAVCVLVGAGIGLLSGVVWVGGGIFLSPLILLFGWADARQTAATSAVFIAVNSLAALSGRYVAHNVMLSEVWPLIGAALAGGLLGSYVGARLLRGITLCRLLAAVLLVAALKLLLQHSVR